MFKLGRMTNPGKNIVKEIIKAKKLGFDYVEIGIEPPTDSGIFKKNKTSILNLLKKFSNDPIGHTSWWYDLSSPYESVRVGWLKQAKIDISVANELGIRLLNFHFNVPSDLLLKNKNSRNVILRNYIENLNQLTNFAKNYRILLMLENCGEKFEYYKYVLNNVPNLKVHFDVGHAFISDGMSTIRKFISYFNDRISHIHIHDNNGKYDEHLALGKGKINWKVVVSLLKKSKYYKTFTVEVFKSEKELIKSCEYFKKLWCN